METLDVGSLGTVILGARQDHEGLLGAFDPWQSEQPPQSEEASRVDDVELVEGDVVGALNGTSEWDVIPRGHIGFVGEGVVVLRLASECPVPPAYLASFLRYSSERDPIQSETDLRSRKIPIPALNRDELTRLASGLTSVRSKLRGVESDIASREARLWESRSAQNLAKHLRELAFQAAATSSAVSTLSESEALFGLEQVPYVAAAHYRVAATTLDSREEYEGVLRFGSYLGVLLGAIALSWAQQHNQLPATEVWRRAVHHGGVAYGHWLAVAHSVGDVMSAKGDYVTVKDLLLQGQGSLQESLAQLLAERNLVAHGAGPRQLSEVRLRVRDLWPIARRARFAAARFRDHQLVVVERSELQRRGYSDGLDRDTFLLEVAVAMGDHPAFTKEQIPSAVPMPVGTVCIVLSEGLLSLDPYVVRLDCNTCGRSELFHADRVEPSRVRYRSLETNHQIFDTERVAEFPKPVDGDPLRAPEVSEVGDGPAPSRDLMLSLRSRVRNGTMLVVNRLRHRLHLRRRLNARTQPPPRRRR